MRLFLFFCPSPIYFALQIENALQFPLYAAILLYTLWSLRNKIIHEGFQTDL